MSDGQEDCLTLNVQKPSNATTSSKLPVLACIFGGGFVSGSTQIYDGSSLIPKSNDLGSPIVYVAMNYRVGGFGFLTGEELQKESSTNLGLRDQRLALQWVHENIASFGGNLEKVTIWGESAGSASIFAQLLINRGDQSYKGRKLFRAAIMDSGSIFGTQDVTSALPQSIYDSIVSLSGCGGTGELLACLRTKPFETVYNAMNANLGDKLLKANFFPRPDSSSTFFPDNQEVATRKGNIADVPFIIGD